MTDRLYTVLFSLATTLLCALSLGGRLFYLLSFILAAMLLYSLISVLIARRMLTFSQGLSVTEADRGGTATLTMTVQLRSLLPIAPLNVSMQTPAGDAAVMVDAGILRQHTLTFPFTLPHVGVFLAGAKKVILTDVFGLLRLKKTVKEALPEIVALPRPFGVDRLKFPEQDDGKALVNRAGEDVTSPEDTRSYRQGDSLKRIHWKLSQRTQELIVRRFEVPAPPDTLILMDCNDPVGGDKQPDGLMRLRDTLCETALSAAKMQMEEQNPIRVPLYGARLGEFQASHAGSLQLLREELAYQLFRGGERFEKVLNVELRRMRRTGATVVITTRLDAGVVNAVTNIRKSGPSVRFYLVTFTPDDPQSAAYISRLQHHLVEVCYVTPA